MAILVKYQAPPEETIFQHLTENINLVGLNLRNIDCPIILGHALFSEGISQAGQERNFPKIGVEWINDRRSESLGLNHKSIRVTTDLRAELLRYKMYSPEALRLSSNEIISEMIVSKYLDTWSHQIESEVIISGYASGGSGRRTLRWIYEAVDSCLSPMLHDISEKYSVTTFLGETAEVNLMLEAYGMTVWGFEVPVRISQIKTTFRKKMVSDNSIDNKLSTEELDELEKLLSNIGMETNNNSNGNSESIESIIDLIGKVGTKIKVKIGGLQTYGQGQTEKRY